MSSLALFVALGGTSYAVARNSVGERHLKRDAVTSPKVKDGSLAAADLAPGTLLAGPRGPRGLQGPAGPIEPAGGDLQGVFPNPTIRPGALQANEIANPFVFRAHKIASQDTVANEFVTVSLGGEDFDPNGNYDPATSRYTAPLAGYYQLSARVETCCGGGRIFSQIASTRAVEIARGSDITASGIHGSVLSELVRLERGEGIELRVYSSAVNTMPAASVIVFLAGHFVSSG